MEAIAIDSGPLFTIPCLFSPLPDTPNTAYCWDVGSSVDITWNPPQYSRWLVEYRLQQNVGGVYQTIEVIPVASDRRATLTFGNYYRLLAVFNTLGAGYSATQSCRIYFYPGAHFVFASDRVDGLSGSEGNLTVTQYPLAVISCETSTDTIDGLSGSEGNLTVTQYPLAVVTCETSTDTINGLSGSEGSLKSTVYNLTGGIVG
jgi:hypothetical protein